jgi:hypothetical protein
MSTGGARIFSTDDTSGEGGAGQEPERYFQNTDGGYLM